MTDSPRRELIRLRLRLDDALAGATGAVTTAADDIAVADNLDLVNQHLQVVGRRIAHQLDALAGTHPTSTVERLLGPLDSRVQDIERLALQITDAAAAAMAVGEQPGHAGARGQYLVGAGDSPVDACPVRSEQVFRGRPDRSHGHRDPFFHLPAGDGVAGGGSSGSRRTRPPRADRTGRDGAEDDEPGPWSHERAQWSSAVRRSHEPCTAVRRPPTVLTRRARTIALIDKELAQR